MRLMTSTGLLLSIIFGLLKLSNLKEVTALFGVLIVMSAILGVIGIFANLLIIQSDEIRPAGNDGLVLLKDISDKYSEHEEKVDYVIVLSDSRVKNEALIKRNGRYLGFSSWTFFIMLICMFLAAVTLL